jgi:hypothetical protein
MPTIGPKRTAAELQKSAKATREDGRRVPLPGVKSDAKEVDTKAYNANRKLAKQIQAAVKDLKETDGGKPRFVLAWRMYPNADSPHWSKNEHSCGCSCGCGP